VSADACHRYAANAVSVSVPLAGPGLATGFIFRRLTRQGADAPLAGWSLLTGGVTGLALTNWLADAAVLAVSIRATGAAVPWHDLLLVYGS
jgi:uncharacterized membrane protein YbhN (UPF0104 family)